MLAFTTAHPAMFAFTIPAWHNTIGWGWIIATRGAHHERIKRNLNSDIFDSASGYFTNKIPIFFAHNSSKQTHYYGYDIHEVFLGLDELNRNYRRTEISQKLNEGYKLFVKLYPRGLKYPGGTRHHVSYLRNSSTLWWKNMRFTTCNDTSKMIAVVLVKVKKI